MPDIVTTHRYATEDDCAFADSYELTIREGHRNSYDLDDEWDAECLAELCAEQYRDDHDGWERTSWMNGSEPLPVYLWRTPTEKIKYEVWVEFQPVYSARLTKEKEQSSE